MTATNPCDLFDGLLLGDGHIERSGRFRIGQSGVHRPWIPILIKQLETFGISASISSVKPGRMVSKGKIYVRRGRDVLTTRTTSWLKEQRFRWYKRGVKVIPQDVSLVPESLAAWLCGDGICAGGGYRIEFCTDAFTKSEVLLLMHQISLKYGWSLQRSRRNRIVLCRQEDRTSFRSLVKDYIPLCFEHKIAIRERSLYYKLDEAKREKLRALRLEGLSIDDLAETFLMSRSGVYGALKKMNLTGTRIPRRWQKKPKEEK